MVDRSLDKESPSRIGRSQVSAIWVKSRKLSLSNHWWHMKMDQFSQSTKDACHVLTTQANLWKCSNLPASAISPAKLNTVDKSFPNNIWLISKLNSSENSDIFCRCPAQIPMAVTGKLTRNLMSVRLLNKYTVKAHLLKERHILTQNTSLLFLQSKEATFQRLYHKTQTCLW